jgi:hypothetical protein
MWDVSQRPRHSDPNVEISGGGDTRGSHLYGKEMQQLKARATLPTSSRSYYKRRNALFL